MVDPVEDYWPAEISDASDPAPVALLKEQATLLGRKTRGQVEGVVKVTTEDGTAFYSLYLKAEALGDYLYKLLYIAHPAIRGGGDVFPMTAQNSFGGPRASIPDLDTFRHWLRAELSSEHVRSAIANLMRYVRDARLAAGTS